MKEIDIKLPPNYDPNTVATTVQRIAKDMSLSISMTSTLKRFPGSVHWHFKNNALPGTLEMTWWIPDESDETPRLWFSINKNRCADWMLDVVPTFAKRLEIDFG